MVESAMRQDGIEASFKIVTPMFLGGADQSPGDGIRPPSVKGALRFWWRALHWGRCREQTDSDETALQRLHQQEVRLFGGLAEQGGQGRFLLSVPSKTFNCHRKDFVHAQLNGHDAARYLGYGLMEAFSSNTKHTKAGQLSRGCIDEDQHFNIKLLFRGGFDTSIQQALIAMGLLGGLGSRVRHGLGSLSLQALQKNGESIWSAPTNKLDYIKAVQNLLAECSVASDHPPFTAFSQHARIDVLLADISPYALLNAFGHAELMYRSWGNNGMVLNTPSEQRFKGDHDWSKGCRLADFHPQRAVFGLPHNYGKPTTQQVNGEHHDRRSSPLLFHVHALSNKSFIGTSVFLPARFLPKGEKINAGGDLVTPNIEWSLIGQFLDGKVGDPPTSIDRFPDKVSVIKAIL